LSDFCRFLHLVRQRHVNVMQTICAFFVERCYSIVLIGMKDENNLIHTVYG